MDLKNISKDIPQIVIDWAEKNAVTNKSFVSVLNYRDGEVIERTFATRRYKKDGVKITEVRRRATGETATLVKNLTFCTMGGYNPVFVAKDIISRSGWGYKVFEKEWFDRWDYAAMPINIDCKVLNKDMLTSIEEFKYCGYWGGDVIEYLNKYRENPIVELFGKLHMSCSASLIKLASKNKAFRKYVFKNSNDIKSYGPQATVHAYRHNISIGAAYIHLHNRRQALRYIPSLKGTPLDFDKVIDWCDYNDIDYGLYDDYLFSVKELGLDLNNTKNVFPKDFSRIHAVRSGEYEQLKLKRDRQKRKALYKKFAEAGQAAKKYELETSQLIIKAPEDITELKREGKALNHCVGKMDYDKKMAEGDIVIMFVRQTKNVEVPYVTLEYSLKDKRLKQLYGRNNTKPSADVVEFVNNWCQEIKKRIGVEEIGK